MFARQIAVSRLAPLVAALLMLLLVAVPTPARAGLEAMCDPGEVCLFDWSDYRRGYAGWQGNRTRYYTGASGTCLFSGWEPWHHHLVYYCTDSAPGWVRNNAASIDNDGLSCATRHYNKAYYNGRNFRIARGGHRANLTGSGFKNNLESHKWVSCS